MTTTEARDVFNQAIASSTDQDRIAKLELMREYFTNQEFRQHLLQTVWDMTNKQPT